MNFLSCLFGSVDKVENRDIPAPKHKDDKLDEGVALAALITKRATAERAMFDVNNRPQEPQPIIVEKYPSRDGIRHAISDDDLLMPLPLNCPTLREEERDEFFLFDRFHKTSVSQSVPNPLVYRMEKTQKTLDLDADFDEPSVVDVIYTEFLPEKTRDFRSRSVAENIKNEADEEASSLRHKAVSRVGETVLEDIGRTAEAVNGAAHNGIMGFLAAIING